MTEYKVSNRYARALLETAREEKVLDEVFSDFKTIDDVVSQSRELQVFIKSPIVQFWKKKKVFTELFGPFVSKLTMSFILLLANKRREALLLSIMEQFITQYNVLKNRLPVKIFSAVELNEDVRKKVVMKLESTTGKTVLPDFQLDESIKGGIVVRIDDWVFDASVRNQLEVLFKKLATGQPIS